MDDRTFRRLAPDAVAGRLDAGTYDAWRRSARGNPERERFVVQVAEAAARMSELPRPVRRDSVKEKPQNPRPHTFWMLAPLFAAFGALGGVLGMYSLLKAQQSAQEGTEQSGVHHSVAPDETDDEDSVQVQEPPGPDEMPSPEQKPEVEPEVPRSFPEPIPVPEPEPAELRLTVGDGTVRVRGRNEAEWGTVVSGHGLAEGDRVAVLDGVATFESDRLVIHATGRAEFELTARGARFIQGKASVTARNAAEFTARDAAWKLEGGAFVVELGRRDGSLAVIQGEAEIEIEGDTTTVPLGRFVNLGAGVAARVLGPDETRRYERDLRGLHRVLLSWDGETETSTPARGERITPGALGSGHALTRARGQIAIGALPGEELFAAVEGARLRMRIRTDAPRVRIEMRVHLDEGYRAVDAHVDVPVLEEWTVIDVPLSVLRAGRARTGEGWIPGRMYSAFTIAPEVDLERPMLRRELTVDDVLIYVPRAG